MYMKEQGLLIELDSRVLETAVREVLQEHPGTMEEYRNGKEKVLGFLVGQVMRKMKGKANPGKVNQMLKEGLKDAEVK